VLYKIFIKIVHISIKRPPVNSEVLVYLKNIESPAHLRYSSFQRKAQISNVVRAFYWKVEIKYRLKSSSLS
jgi:hypothetical protein